MECLFEKFDVDFSGEIEMDELYEIFESNGIPINKNQLRNLFNILNTDG